RRAEFLLPIGAPSRERGGNRTDDRFANSIRIAKAHFSFRGMHVHVDRAGIQFNKKKCDRVLYFHQRGLVAFAHRLGDNRTFDRAAIHKNELLRTTLATQSSLTDQSVYSNLR